MLEDLRMNILDAKYLLFTYYLWAASIWSDVA